MNFPASKVYDARYPRLNRFRVVLVGTKIPENLGSTARLLENFAVGEAALVSPQCEYHEGVAQRVATNESRDRLNTLPVFDQLQPAVEDCQVVIGFSARTGRDRKPNLSLDQISDLPGKVALVFGREDYCLFDEELESCTHLCALETSLHFPALNLSHSIAVVLAQLFMQENNSRRAHARIATQSELAPMIEHLREMMLSVRLTEAGNPNRMLKKIKKIFQRASLTPQEIILLRGLYSKVISHVNYLQDLKK